MYFYNEAKDNWDKQMAKLSKLLTIQETHDNGVVVNLSDLIESKIDKLKKTNLFHVCNTDAIMSEINVILSGYVSEGWLEQFVNTLK